MHQSTMPQHQLLQLQWHSSFSKGIIALATFGASITFSVILSDIPDPAVIRERRRLRSKASFGSGSGSGHATQPAGLRRRREGGASAGFDAETVRTFLAVAWLMFVLALGFAILGVVRVQKRLSGTKTTVSYSVASDAFGGSEFVNDDGMTSHEVSSGSDGGGGSSRTAKVLEGVIELLVLAAFMFLALAVGAYVPEVGWAGVGFISFFAVCVGCMWCW